MNTPELVATLEAKVTGYESLCGIRQKLHGAISPDDLDICTEMLELEAMKAPGRPGMPALDGSILLVLQEISIFVEFLSERIQQKPGV